MPKSTLRKLEEMIFGVKRKTPSQYAYQKARLHGTRRTYEHGTSKLEQLERQYKRESLKAAKSANAKAKGGRRK